MAEHQSHLIIKRFQAMQRWEQGSWMALNTLITVMAYIAKRQDSPYYMVGAIVLVLFVGPKLYRLYKKKQRQLLGNNSVKLPVDWDRRMSAFTHYAGWQFILYLAFVLAYFLPRAWAYATMAILYVVSLALEWRVRRKQAEVAWYLQAYQPHESPD
ncbi:MAG: hypothetical protein V1668_02575 [Patescibacteria group bacterium]